MNLHCNHEPTKTEGIGTGYAVTEEGHKICYDCADERHKKQMQADGVIQAYVSNDGKAVTTWSGGKLLTIIGGHIVDFGYCRHQFSFSAYCSETKTRWHGRGPGNGMYCTVRRYK